MDIHILDLLYHSFVDFILTSCLVVRYFSLFVVKNKLSKIFSMSGKIAGQQQQQCDAALWDTRGRRRTGHPKWCITRSLWWIWVITMRAEIQGTYVDFPYPQFPVISGFLQLHFGLFLLLLVMLWSIVVIVVNLLLLLLFSLSLNSCTDTPGNLWQEEDMAAMNKSSKVWFHFTEKDENSVCCNVCKIIIPSQGWNRSFYATWD